MKCTVHCHIGKSQIDRGSIIPECAPGEHLPGWNPALSAGQSHAHRWTLPGFLPSFLSLLLYSKQRVLPLVGHYCCGPLLPPAHQNTAPALPVPLAKAIKGLVIIKLPKGVRDKPEPSDDKRRLLLCCYFSPSKVCAGDNLDSWVK